MVNGMKKLIGLMLLAWCGVATAQVVPSAFKTGYFNATNVLGYQYNGTTILATPIDIGTQYQTLVGYQAGAGISSSFIDVVCVGYQTCGGTTGTLLSGSEGTAVGDRAGSVMASDSGFTAVGVYSMYYENASSNTTCVGNDCMRNTRGVANSTGVGASALRNCIGSGNTAMGVGALQGTNAENGGGAPTGVFVCTGTQNVAIGYNTMASSSLATADSNTAVGVNALLANVNSNGNVAVGYGSLSSLTGGNSDNVGVGLNAGKAITNAWSNTIIGNSAGATYPTTGGWNILIGQGVNAPGSSSNYTLDIGDVISGTTGQGGTNPTVCAAGMTCVLGVLRGANLNVTTDQSITIQPIVAGQNGYLPSITKYIVTGMFVTNCSISTTTAAGGLYTAASKGGTALVAAAQTYTNCTASNTMQTATLAAAAQSFVATGGTIYFSLTSAQGSADTGDVYVLGIPFN